MSLRGFLGLFAAAFAASPSPWTDHHLRNAGHSKRNKRNPNHGVRRGLKNRKYCKAAHGSFGSAAGMTTPVAFTPSSPTKNGVRMRYQGENVVNGRRIPLLVPRVSQRY